MSDVKTTKIYIDNCVWADDEKFAKILQQRLSAFRVDAAYDVLSFSDLDVLNEEMDPNNEHNTLNAIQNSDIVIPIVTSRFINFITSNIEASYNSVISSSDRYFFPILLAATDWSSHDWLVKTQLTPLDAIPLNEHSDNDRETIINDLIKTIKASIIELSKAGKDSQIDRASRKVKRNNIVFISHDHDDADFAELLKLRLEKEKIDSWIDTERLKIGQDWREEIDQGIEDSVAVIAIMTPEARKSEYVTYEWAFAWGK